MRQVIVFFTLDLNTTKTSILIFFFLVKMWYFYLLQWIKDCMAVLVFVLLANMPQFLHSSGSLSLFFALGCLLDTLFCCVCYWKAFDVTTSCIKDAFGAVGLWIMTLVVVGGKTGTWVSVFFYIAAVIDYLSICSIVSSYNIYTQLLW